MFRRIRSVEVVWLGMVSAALFQSAPVSAQGKGQGEPEPIPSLRASVSFTKRLDAARSYLQMESWAEVVRALQWLLDRQEDALVSVKGGGDDDEDLVRWTGIRGEAVRLLGALPAEGREFYAATYGPRAKALLARATKKGDMRLVTEVARRYPTTAAGVEAIRLLGAYHLDRTQYLLAALWFERLMQSPQAGELTPATLFHAALAFRGVGDRTRADRSWREMIAKARGGLRLGDRAVSLADLQEEFDRVEVPVPPRPAFVLEGIPSLESRWTRPTAYETNTRDWLQSAAQKQDAREQPALSASVPILAGDRIVYRSSRGLHAVNVRTGREAWQAPSAWSMDRMTSQPLYSSHLESWVNDYLEVSPHLLFGNAVLGTLAQTGTASTPSMTWPFRPRDVTSVRAAGSRRLVRPRPGVERGRRFQPTARPGRGIG